MAGTALGAAAVLGAGTGSVAAAGAEGSDIDAKDIGAGTLEVESGESIEIHVGSNENGDYGDLEDVLIDITASGADAIIKTHGGDWTVKNVGVEGESDGDMGSSPMLSVRSDGEGLVENVYLGDGGNHGDHDGGRQGILVQRDHAGTATIRNTNISNWGNNGIYGSGPGKSGGEDGEVHIENCYAENNNVANFRIGSSNSSVTDSVSVTDGDGQYLVTSRGVWCEQGDDLLVENTDISLEGSAASLAVGARDGASVTYTDSDYYTDNAQEFEGDVDTENVGTDPSTSPPSGVPMSAEEAVGSSSSSDSSISDEEADEEADMTDEESKDESSETDEEDSTEDDTEESDDESSEEDEEDEEDVSSTDSDDEDE